MNSTLTMGRAATISPPSSTGASHRKTTTTKKRSTTNRILVFFGMIVLLFQVGFVVVTDRNHLSSLPHNDNNRQSAPDVNKPTINSKQSLSLLNSLPSTKDHAENTIQQQVAADQARLQQVIQMHQEQKNDPRVQKEALRAQKNRQRLQQRRGPLRDSSSLTGLTAPLNATTTSRPPLNTIIDPINNTVIGDAQFLLDFAIIGFGKCGTSTLMHWLASHTSEIDCFREEIWELIYHKPHNLITLLYKGLHPDKKRCYKCPAEITEQHIMDYFRTLWPKTKLFIGIRHPVWWFQSLYNFRVQNLNRGDHMPDPNKLLGRCMKGMLHTCTEKGNFAYHLLRLGKHFGQYKKGTKDTTNVDVSLEDIDVVRRPPTELERNIVAKFKRASYNTTAVPYVPNPVFLFDLAQLADNDMSRREAFRRDVQQFLQLEMALPELIHYKPGRTWHYTIQQEKDAHKINICDDEYAVPLRKELMRLSRQTAEWIRTEFLGRPGVHVSSMEYFRDTIMQDWMVDPCTNVSVQESDVQDEENTENEVIDVGLPVFRNVPAT